MSELKELHAEGVSDVTSYRLGALAERERLVKKVKAAAAKYEGRDRRLLNLLAWYLGRSEW